MSDLLFPKITSNSTNSHNLLLGDLLARTAEAARAMLDRVYGEHGQ